MSKINNLYDIKPNFIDKDALGFSARVVRATDTRFYEQVAFKVLRTEHLDDEETWKRFAVEARLLDLLKEQPAIVKLLDCGFVSDISHACPIEGEIISFENDIEGFAAKITEFRNKHWRPYLGLELMQTKNSLLVLVRGTTGDGNHPLRLPTEEGINLSMQFLEFLVDMHNKEAIYIDYKPEHVYWDGSHFRIIDFNLSKLLDRATSGSANGFSKRIDLQHFIKGVLYTVFTGRDFRYQDQAPVGRPSDPNAIYKRFESAEYLDFKMQETLLPQLVTLMYQSLISDAFLTAESLLEEFRKCAAILGWSNVGYPVTEESIKKRNEILKGLVALRDGQRKIQEAREHFLEAETYNKVDEESMRLYLATSVFYQNRVLP